MSQLRRNYNRLFIRGTATAMATPERIKPELHDLAEKLCPKIDQNDPEYRRTLWGYYSLVVMGA